MKFVKVLVTQLCLTLCNPMDCSLPGSSVHGVSQASILESVAISFLQGNVPTQGLNPCLLCLLHWQVGSLPLGPQIGAVSFYPMRVCSVISHV